ncbi:MAG: translation initiation factor IF-2 [Bacteroidaceae bacterium]|nr:translation initiation factor IF-2 [Bacteroidaceae bacterium]
MIRISKATKEFNVGLTTIVEFLAKKGHEIPVDPNHKLTDEQYELVQRQFSSDRNLRNTAQDLSQKRQVKEERKVYALPEQEPKPKPEPPKRPEVVKPKVVGKIDLGKPGVFVDEEHKRQEAEKAEREKKERAEREAAEVAAKAKAAAEEAARRQAEAAKAEATAETKPAEAKPAEEKPAESQVTTYTNHKGKVIGEEKDGVFRLTTHDGEVQGLTVKGHIDLSTINQSTRPKKKSRDERRREREAAQGEKKKRTRVGKEKVDIAAEVKKGQGGQNGKPGAQPQGKGGGKPGQQQPQNQGSGKKKKKKNQQPIVQEVSEEDVARQVKETLARLTAKGKSASSKYRRDKRDSIRQGMEEAAEMEAAESKVLKLTEFVTANDLATMMGVPVTKVIGTCMSIGMMVSINQRMDAETINIVADEFGFKTEYVSAEVQEAIHEEEDREEDLVARAPIVTVMGHVDHGKTSLLDYIRKTNVIAGEAGGITQHIGAYNVKLDDGRHITFLDTPGHEAFTAMRARGAQVTDIAIIIIAADDDIMPQTREAIDHAVAANVPIVFAINKVDKPAANPEKIKEGLAAMNFLVEDWGGKYQSQDISAKHGQGVPELMEKVLLEAEMLDLKANPNRKATGSVIESSLDKGRGYVATVLVSNGTLHVGDVVLAGTHYGRVRAMLNERGQRVEQIGPSQAATLLGLDGAPTAGDTFHVMESDQEAREVATKRLQLQREQGLRTQTHLTLDEIGRRIALGGFQELQVIVKGDVDGSIEALSDSLIKLSTEKIAVNVIRKAVGQISESDVALAAASDAIIVGFQVRPSAAARKMAEQQGVDIRLYSIIYDALNEVRSAMEGMLAPEIKEEKTGEVEVRQVYHITKVGTVAGAFVLDGKVERKNKARVIRDGIVVFTGQINALKRFKDDVKEVSRDFECGISLVNYNDIREGDIIETFNEIEVKATL